MLNDVDTWSKVRGKLNNYNVLSWHLNDDYFKIGCKKFTLLEFTLINFNQQSIFWSIRYNNILSKSWTHIVTYYQWQWNNGTFFNYVKIKYYLNGTMEWHCIQIPFKIKWVQINFNFNSNSIEMNWLEWNSTKLWKRHMLIFLFMSYRWIGERR